MAWASDGNPFSLLHIWSRLNNDPTAEEALRAEMEREEGGLEQRRTRPRCGPGDGGLGNLGVGDGHEQDELQEQLNVDDGPMRPNAVGGNNQQVRLFTSVQGKRTCTQCTRLSEINRKTRQSTSRGVMFIH